MIEAAVLLGAIAVADLVRAPTTQAGWCRALGIVAVVAVAVGSQMFLGILPIAVATVVVVGVGWVLLMGADPVRGATRIWPAIVVGGLAAAAATGYASGASPTAELLHYYSATPLGQAGVTPTTSLVALATTLFMMRSANLIARGAITSRAAERSTTTDPRPASRSTETESSRGSAIWRVKLRRADLATIERVEAEKARRSRLVGGRVIGPTERILLVALLLTGNVTIVAALIAAKGVVRFPEISADREDGLNAETFLVGSLTSWSIAGGAALMIWASAG